MLMKRIYLPLLLCFLSLAGYAQTAASYVFSQATSTYTTLVGGTNIYGATTAWDDNSTAAGAIPIGFTFNYIGTDYTTIGVNSNRCEQ